MDTDKAQDLSTTSSEPLPHTSPESEAPPAAGPAASRDPEPSWNRRTFLRAAALGAAVAGAMLVDRDKAGHVHFGGAAALANDLSGNPCTAQDVEIIGSGIVQNEPCSCAGGSFNAVVKFTVRNTTSTGRYCIGLHLVNAVDADGNVLVAGQDVLLHNVDANGNILTTSTAPGKSGGASFADTVMAGTIVNFPCNSGGTLVCFGTGGVTTGKCAAGTCTTISWNTSTGAASCTAPDQKPPGGQCRHQGVCVQGFGATLQCADNCPATTTSGAPCSAECGADLYLQAAAAGASSQATTAGYTFVLKDPDGNVVASTSAGASSPQCFTVTSPKTGTYTCTATDSGGCSRSATAAVVVSNITAGIALAAGQSTACGDGNLTFQGSVTGCGSNATPSYSWVGATAKATDSSQAVYSPNPDSKCHTVSVTVTCGNCQDTKSMNVSQCITSTVNSGACP